MGNGNQSGKVTGAFAWAAGRVRRIFGVWKVEIRNVIFSSRWVVVTLLSFLLLSFYLQGVLEMANVYHAGVSPVVLPFLFSDSTFGNLGLMVLVFLMGVFPFRDNLQRGLRMKAGNRCYAVAQVLAMATIAAAWVLEMALLSILVVGRNCAFGSWGKVWGACASGKAVELGYGVMVNVDLNIILNYKPWQALLVSALLVVGVSIIFAEIIFLLDSLAGFAIGEVLLAVYCFVFFALSTLELSSVIRAFAKVNPSGWMNISSYMLDEGKWAETAQWMGILFLILTIADYEVIRRKYVSEL